MKRFRSSQVLPNNKFSASESSDGLGLAGLKYVSVPTERSDQSYLRPHSAATNKTGILTSHFFSCIKTTCQYSQGIIVSGLKVVGARGFRTPPSPPRFPLGQISKLSLAEFRLSFDFCPSAVPVQCRSVSQQVAMFG